MTKPNIYGIFPTPIYFSNINRKFNSKELLFIENNKCKINKNEGNATSNDNYILNNKVFKDLKEDLDLKVKDYFEKVISPTEAITPYITQSWLNYTETNQYHPKHAHPNSLLSAVLYINADEKFDKINFYRGEYMPFKFNIKKWNNFNSASWWFPVKTGEVVIFPSSLIHSVETKKGDNTRISLAFNVFIKGTIGKKFELTELHL
tara:strand:+ start:113 stop:727 length:615 start_codon:yes stop_codon:yes gene_type:complete